LTGAIDRVPIIVTAGLAEIAAGSIAMGLGGYLAAKSDAEHLRQGTRTREARSEGDSGRRNARVAESHSYGLSREKVRRFVEALAKHPKKWSTHDAF